MPNRVFQGHVVCKRFGQNFLQDYFIIQSMISAINPKRNQAIVEIGPGLGALTEQIVMYVEHLTVIEIDRYLARRLATHTLLKSKLDIIQQDVMKVDFSVLAKKFGQSLRIFGNLPYNISTPLLFYLFQYINNIQDMHFMLQKEVVDRLISAPNNKLYGRLSVMAQYFCKIVPILEVPSVSFKPVPKVNSAVVRLIPYSTIPYPVNNLYNLATLTKLAFNQRRKTLRNSLRHCFTKAQLIELGIDTTLRAENISVEQYCRLANFLTEDNNNIFKY